MAEEKTFSAKQVATRIGTDAKQLRKFFRDPASGYDAVGQGSRYDFPASQLPEIKSKFDAWSSTKTRRNRARAVPAAGGAIHALPLPRQTRRPRVSDQPKPRLMLSNAEVTQLDQDGKEMLRALGMSEEGFEPDYEGDGYTVNPHNETQPIVDAMETYGDDEIDLFGDYDPDEYEEV